MTFSEACAKRDGIESYIGKGRGGLCRVYKIPCAKCGTVTERRVYSSDKVYLCDYCKKHKAKRKKTFEEQEYNVLTKRERQFEKAVTELYSQTKDKQKYEKAIAIARKRVELYGSIPEAMVAIELIRLGYSIIPQQAVDKYHVDFCIPKEKIVIEVDGELYHRKKFGGDREAVIQMTLGLEWLIIHLPAEKIRKNIKVLDQIITALMLQHRGKK